MQRQVSHVAIVVVERNSADSSFQVESHHHMQIASEGSRPIRLRDGEEEHWTRQIVDGNSERRQIEADKDQRPQ